MNAPLQPTQSASKRPHVIIVGGGFGGLTAAKALKNARVDVTMIDRQNHHLFQPLLYQVATAGMMAEEIAMPIRAALRNNTNTRVVLDEVESADLNAQKLSTTGGHTLDFDYLVLAAGAQNNFFGNDTWQEHALGLKSVEEAYAIRQRVLSAFEIAEREEDPEVRRRLLTFVVIGGGPTGVEMAGSLAELTQAVLAHDYHTVKAHDIRVVLIEMAPRLLLAFHPKLANNARYELTKLGVDVQTGVKVKNIVEGGLVLESGFLPSRLTVWAAGVRPEPLAAKLKGFLPNARGFLVVESDCSLKGFANVFAIGDLAAFVPALKKGAANDGPAANRPLPGVAPVALQQGRHVAKMIAGDVKGKPRTPFKYLDKGSMATIGRSRAVLEAGPIRMTGLFAWLAWIVVHIYFLIGFRNRVMMLFEWGWAYLANRRGARLIIRMPFKSHDEQDSKKQQTAQAHRDPSQKEGADKDLYAGNPKDLSPTPHPS